MRLVLASVLDTVAGVYSRPFCARSEAEAQRIFLAMCQQDETVKLAPSDYRLYVLGAFDEVEGVIEGVTPRQVGAGGSAPSRENGAKAPGRLRQFLSGRQR